MKSESSAIFSRVNLYYLEEVTGGSPAALLEIINIFLRDVPLELSRIKTLIKQQRVDKLSVAIHKLAPKFHYVGIADMYETLVQMEQNVQVNGLTSCWEDVEEIERKTIAVINELQQVKVNLHRKLEY